MSPMTESSNSFTADELTFDFTPAQAQAIRAYVSRCEREFLRSLTEKIAMGELKQMFAPPVAR
jgi:hypothetical protein